MGLDTKSTTATEPLIIEARPHEIGEGMTIRRVLPFSRAGITRRHVGPFVFLDHIGPIRSEKPLFVGEHPHIGLATATYLFDGEIRHLDLLGSDQVIRPGELNLMTAGKWITHVEQGLSLTVHGLQFWLALPKTHEQCDPSFSHLEGDAIPTWTTEGLSYQLLMGEFAGHRAATQFPWPTLFVTIKSENQTSLAFDLHQQELAVYVAAGSISFEKQKLTTGQLAFFDPAAFSRIEAQIDDGSQLAVFGGAALDGEREMKWNYVASRRDLITAAETRWQSFEKTIKV